MPECWWSADGRRSARPGASRGARAPGSPALRGLEDFRDRDRAPRPRPRDPPRRDPRAGRPQRLGQVDVRQGPRRLPPSPIPARRRRGRRAALRPRFGDAAAERAGLRFVHQNLGLIDDCSTWPTTSASRAARRASASSTARRARPGGQRRSSASASTFDPSGDGLDLAGVRAHGGRRRPRARRHRPSVPLLVLDEPTRLAARARGRPPLRRPAPRRRPAARHPVHLPPPRRGARPVRPGHGAARRRAASPPCSRRAAPTTRWSS